MLFFRIQTVLNSFYYSFLIIQQKTSATYNGGLFLQNNIKGDTSQEKTLCKEIIPQNKNPRKSRGNVTSFSTLLLGDVRYRTRAL